MSYDYILTLSSETRLFWNFGRTHFNFTSASLFFFLNRYLSLVFVVARLWLPDSQRVASDCQWAAYHTAQASMEQSPVMHDMNIIQEYVFHVRSARSSQREFVLCIVDGIESC